MKACRSYSRSPCRFSRLRCPLSASSSRADSCCRGSLLQQEVIGLGDNFAMIVDEEGKLRDWKVGFRLGTGEGIAGNALIVCERPDEDFTDCPLLYGLVIKSLVLFLELEKTPLPPPAFGFAAITDLSPASIVAIRRKNSNASISRRSSPWTSCWTS